MSVETPWNADGYCGPRTNMASAAAANSEVVDISKGPK